MIPQRRNTRSEVQIISLPALLLEAAMVEEIDGMIFGEWPKHGTRWH